MKTIEKQFDAVKFMRQQRDKMSEKLSTMTKTEITEYLKRRKDDNKAQCITTCIIDKRYYCIGTIPEPFRPKTLPSRVEKYIGSLKD